VWTYATTFRICGGVRRYRNAGMIRLKPRTGPPSRTIAAQSADVSREAKLQSVKSGSGLLKPTVVCGAPLPVAP